MLKVDLSSWVGATETTEGVLDVNTAAMLHAIFETGDAPAPQNGDEMAPLAHWSAFSPKVVMADLSKDGHPHLGRFMPPVTLERRMWAGGEVSFLAPMRVGVPMQRRSVISAVTEKDGETGPMVFVTVSHEMSQDGVLCAQEVNTIVYLDIPERFVAPRAKPIPPEADFVQDMAVSEALLFRYSAATFNAHRIHYDLAYAQEVEKYPGLVVHGLCRRFG